MVDTKTHALVWDLVSLFFGIGILAFTAGFQVTLGVLIIARAIARLESYRGRAGIEAYRG